MPRQKSLATLSVDALLKLRDDIGEVLANKTTEMRNQLARLGEWGSSGGEKAKRGRKPKGSHPLAGQKLQPKYRNPKDRSQTWAGRGQQPVWLREALKDGAKLDDFAVKKPGRKKAA